MWPNVAGHVAASQGPAVLIAHAGFRASALAEQRWIHGNVRTFVKGPMRQPQCYNAPRSPQVASAAGLPGNNTPPLPWSWPW